MSGVPLREGRIAILALLALCLLPASCTILPPRRPLGPTPQPLTATPLPPPLVDVSGTGVSYLSHNFFTPSGGWYARWSYDCGPAAQRQQRWRVSVVARQVRPRARPRAQTIVTASSGRLPLRAHGSISMTIRGKLFIEVQATSGCSWRVRAQANGS